MRKVLAQCALIALMASWETAVYAQTSSTVIPTADEIKNAHTIIEDDLVVPESAIYRNVTVTRTRHALIFCGEVNARNSDGDYTGFMPFVLFGNDLTMYDGPPSGEGLFIQNEMYICDTGLRWTVDGFGRTESGNSLTGIGEPDEGR